MRWASWIRNGKRSVERRWVLNQTLRRKAVARRRASRPRLEDRWLLSTYTVTSAADDGSTGTLRLPSIRPIWQEPPITEIDSNTTAPSNMQTISSTGQ